MHVQNEVLPKELKHVCVKNYRKAGKIYKKSEADPEIERLQETKAHQILRQTGLKDVRKLKKEITLLTQTYLYM